MCGRFVVALDREDLLAFFGVNGELPGLHDMPPRYNIAPTQPILTILGNDTRRQAALMRWSFMPDWVKDPSSFSLINNARAETAATKPSFRNALRYRRCLIPASGFYEWNRKAEAKQPYYMTTTTGEPIAIAGIWETWMGPNGEEQDGVAVLTIASNQTMSQVHHRMPVMLEQVDFSRWLDTSSGRADEITPLLKAQREDYLSITPVAKDVNKVTNDHSKLLDRAEIDKDADTNDRQQETASKQLKLF